MTAQTPIISNPVTEFAADKFKHPSALKAYQALLQTLRGEFSPQIIIFTGPTGVGKSTLARAVGHATLDMHRPRMLAEPDFVPVVGLNAVPPTGGYFSWKDFYVRLLAGQNEPLVERKLLVPAQIPLFADGGGTGTLERSVTDALRRSTEEYLRRRRTKLLIVDEAHHLLLVNSSHRLECQFEALKSLTIETGVTILLSGTYRLLDILEQSGQLTRRSQVVNFARYDMRRKTDAADFRRSLCHMEMKLSSYVTARLDEHAEYFYRKSVGCVGILKDWLTRCLDHALQEKAPVIDAAFAERYALTNRGLVNILEEACWGENKLVDVGDEPLTDLLKTGVLVAREEKRDRSSSRRPGQRNPRRDPTGGVRP